MAMEGAHKGGEPCVACELAKDRVLGYHYAELAPYIVTYCDLAQNVHQMVCYGEAVLPPASSIR